MPATIQMTRVPVPPWAPVHARGVQRTMGDLGAAAKVVISQLLPKIYSELDRRVNAFANDPEQCFQNSNDFPEQCRLDGRYYIGSESFEGNVGDEFYRLWLEVRCSESPRHLCQVGEGCDYLGLEAIVTVDQSGITFEFDEGFNTSSI